MKKQAVLPGYLLLAGSIAFWLSWFLLPDMAGADTQLILEIVKGSRLQFICAVMARILSSVIFILAMLPLARSIACEAAVRAGIGLWIIGAIAMSTGAYFHFIAWCITDRNFHPGEEVIRVMELVQTIGLRFQLPIMLPFFAGAPMLAWGLYRQACIPKAPVRIFFGAFIVGGLGVLIDNMFDLNISRIELAPLTIFAIGLLATGFELVKEAKKETSAMHGIIAYRK